MLEKPNKTRRAERSRARGMHGVTAPIRVLHLAAEECTMLYKTDKNGALRVGRHGCSFLEKGDSLKLPSQRCNVLEQQQKWERGKRGGSKISAIPKSVIVNVATFCFLVFVRVLLFPLRAVSFCEVQLTQFSRRFFFLFSSRKLFHQVHFGPRVFADRETIEDRGGTGGGEPRSRLWVYPKADLTFPDLILPFPAPLRPRLLVKYTSQLRNGICRSFSTL